MAATPSHPASRAERAGTVMSVTLGDSLAHTGRVAAALIQPHTSCRISGSWPMAMPIWGGMKRGSSVSVDIEREYACV